MERTLIKLMRQVAVCLVCRVFSWIYETILWRTHAIRTSYLYLSNIFLNLIWMKILNELVCFQVDPVRFFYFVLVSFNLIYTSTFKSIKSSSQSPYEKRKLWLKSVGLKLLIIWSKFYNLYIDEMKKLVVYLSRNIIAIYCSITAMGWIITHKNYNTCLRVILLLGDRRLFQECEKAEMKHWSRSVNTIISDGTKLTLLEDNSHVQRWLWWNVIKTWTWQYFFTPLLLYSSYLQYLISLLVYFTKQLQWRSSTLENTSVVRFWTSSPVCNAYRRHT